MGGGKGAILQILNTKHPLHHPKYGMEEKTIFLYILQTPIH